MFFREMNEITLAQSIKINVLFYNFKNQLDDEFVTLMGRYLWERLIAAVMSLLG